MKVHTLLLSVLALVGSVAAGHAQVLIVTNASVRGTTNFGTSWFTGVDLLAGDYFVVAHANNKNANANNTISAAFTGSSDSFSSINSGVTGTNSGAWVFYAPITTNATSVTFTLSTTSTNNSVSQATTYWVLRPSSGQTLSLASTAVSAVGTNSPATSTLLDFNFTNSFTGALGIAAVSGATTNISSVAGSSTWATNIVSAGTAFRGNFSLASYSNGMTDPTVTMAAASDIAAAGLVVQSIPEPSTMALAGLGLAATLWRIRRRRG